MSEATALEQLAVWGNQGYYVSLAINDGHETELGKASYCLFVSNDDGSYVVGDKDIFDSIEEAIEAVKAAPFEEWKEE